MNGWIGVKYVLRIAYSFKVFDKMNKIKISTKRTYNICYILILFYLKSEAGTRKPPTTILAIVDAKLKYIV